MNPIADRALPRGSAARPRWRHVAVVIDTSERSLRALQEAVALARRGHARLTIICVTSRPWPTVGLAGVCPLSLHAAQQAEARRTVQRLTATVPPDLPCTTYARCGSTATEAVRIIARERADVLVICPRSGLRGRWATKRLVRHTSADVVILRQPDPASSGQVEQTTLSRSTQRSPLAGLDISLN